MKSKALKILTKYLVILLGTAIYAYGTVFFIDSHTLAPGGVTGIAIILNKIIPGNPSIALIIFTINIPLLIIGLIKFGKEFLFGTVFGTLSSSLTVFLCELLYDHLLTTNQTWFKVENPIIAGITGGVLLGCGVALVFRMGATTGGVDIIVKLVRQKFRHLKTGRIFLIFDIIVAFSSLFVAECTLETVLYSILTLVACNYIFDLVLYGADEAKLVYVVSDNFAKITARIINDLDISATYLDGEGAYTGTKKKVIMCVVKKPLFPRLKDIVAQEDPEAFLIISSAGEIYGEGYKSAKEQEK